MTQEQKDIVDCAGSDVRRVSDTLESVELILRDLGNIKVDESDPYSTRTDQIADEIYEAREALDRAWKMSRNFMNTDVEGE